MRTAVLVSRFDSRCINPSRVISSMVLNKNGVLLLRAGVRQSIDGRALPDDADDVAGDAGAAGGGGISGWRLVNGRWRTAWAKAVWRFCWRFSSPGAAFPPGSCGSTHTGSLYHYAAGSVCWLNGGFCSWHYAHLFTYQLLPPASVPLLHRWLYEQWNCACSMSAHSRAGSDCAPLAHLRQKATAFGLTCAGVVAWFGSILATRVRAAASPPLPHSLTLPLVTATLRYSWLDDYVVVAVPGAVRTPLQRIAI